MIALHSDALLVQTSEGELIPCSAETVVIEMIGESTGTLDPAVLQQAAAAVLHYFRTELGRQTVTVGEFAQALTRVLRSFGLDVQEAGPARGPTPPAGTDLRRIADDGGTSSELTFFPRLRLALRDQLAKGSAVVRFSGLRGCVKHLAGARRWSPRCDRLRDQIVEYLRHCLHAEPRASESILVVR